MRPFHAIVAASMLMAGFARAAVLAVPSQYPTINAALDQSAPGDTVLVAPGTYTHADTRIVDLGGGPATNTAMAFLPEGVAVVSEAGPSATTLDMSQVAQGGAMAFACALYTGGTTVVDGFTITDGGTPGSHVGFFVNYVAALSIRNCVIRDFNSAVAGGAGMRGAYSDGVEITGTVFENCVAQVGGGILWYEVSGVLDGCEFRDCQSAVDLDGVPFFPTETAEIRGCEFSGNHIGPSSIGADTGGALRLSGSAYLSLTVEDCVFVDNTAYAAAGAAGLVATVGATVTLRGNTFLRCKVTDPIPGGPFGGAAFVQGGTAVVENNTFSDCSVPAAYGSAGSALVLWSTIGRLSNTVIAGSSGAAAVQHIGGGSVTPTCNVFWNNADGDVAGFQLSGSDRVVDPLFCDPTMDDLTVAKNSPCLPAYSNGCGQIGAWGEGCGTVSVEASSWGKIKGGYR